MAKRLLVINNLSEEIIIRSRLLPMIGHCFAAVPVVADLFFFTIITCTTDWLTFLATSTMEREYASSTSPSLLLSGCISLVSIIGYKYHISDV